MPEKKPLEIHNEHSNMALNAFKEYPTILDLEIRTKYLEQLQEELKALTLTILFLVVISKNFYRIVFGFIRS